MPIKPENRALYPLNWKTEIRPAILLRANNCCERCNVPNRTDIVRMRLRAGREMGKSSDFANVWLSHDGEGEIAVDADTGAYIGPVEIEPYCDGWKAVHIVLTIAHLHDPDPANCDPANLAALCQRCHNIHDLPHRQANAKVTRAAKRDAARGQPSLFSAEAA